MESKRSARSNGSKSNDKVSVLEIIKQREAKAQGNAHAVVPKPIITSKSKLLSHRSGQENSGQKILTNDSLIPKIEITAEKSGTISKGCCEGSSCILF